MCRCGIAKPSQPCVIKGNESSLCLISFYQVLAIIEKQSVVLKKDIDLGASREEAEKMLKEEDELKEQIKVGPLSLPVPKR